MAQDLTVPTGGAQISAASDLSKRQKAAIIVQLVRSEGIDLPLQSLSIEQQIALAHEVGRLNVVNREVLRDVVEEFIAELNAVGIAVSGGVRGAIASLEGSLSPGALDALRAEVGRDNQGDAWARLGDIDAEKVVDVLRHESIEIGAIALSKLKVQRAAEILGKLPSEMARRLAYAMGQTSGIDPATVDRIGQTLLQQFDAEAPQAFDGGPVERVGAILNSSPAATRETVLDALDQEDKGFADEVRKAIFTFTNIPERIDPRDVPKIIREMEASALTTALMADPADTRAQAVIDFLLSNMSKRMGDQLREEVQEAAKPKASEVEEAQNQMVAAIRTLESRREIMLIAPDGE
ncbi:MAG: FliG C-terminal domain-containing protein [Pseudomonadota bacterium]